MANHFADVMAKCSDTELLKIISGPADDYQPAAFEAAKMEFTKRNLSLDQLAIVEKEVEEYKRIKDIKANEPLGAGWKVLSCIFPGLILIMISRLFVAEGYNRKAKELAKWTLIGFGIYAGIVFLIIVLTKIF